MSSFWDSLGQKLMSGELTFTELQDLIVFLSEMDKKNNDMVINCLKLGSLAGYQFIDYDSLLKDVQNKGISKRQLGGIISLLHDLDHSLDQVIMYSYDRDTHYWRDHQCFRTSFGEFKNGKFPPQKAAVKPRLSTMTEKEFEEALLGEYDLMAQELSEMHGGFNMMYTADVVKARKRLWDKYRLTSYQFNVLFQQFYHHQPTDKNHTRVVTLAGAPSCHYKKDNWVEIEGKHYIHFHIDTEGYREMRKMQGIDKE